MREGLDLPEAHLSFFAALEAERCDRAATYLRNGDVAAAARTLSDQRAFFDEHIASWFGDFRDRASAMVTTRFYRGVLKVTDAFFNDEPGMMDELLEYVSQRFSRKAVERIACARDSEGCAVPRARLRDSGACML